MSDDAVPSGRRAMVVVATDRFDDDLDRLLALGFRIEMIRPADAPSTAVVSGLGTQLRLVADAHSSPATIEVPVGVADAPDEPVTLPGGTRIEPIHDGGDEVPPNRPSLIITHDDAHSIGHSVDGVGRAGMRYRDLIPDRWGGRFIASLISIPDGGPVADYVHFHRVRFQMIAVAHGWVRVVYEGQGDPFVMRAGDCVLQPPGIRHRVLEASPGLRVVEVTSPAAHDTIADWSLELPGGIDDPTRTWDGQRFARHVAVGAGRTAWRVPGWDCRDTGIGTATGGLAGVRFARPASRESTSAGPVVLDGEFSLLVVVAGHVSLVASGRPPVLLTSGSSAAIPGGFAHRLVDPTADCELIDVTLPA